MGRLRKWALCLCIFLTMLASIADASRVPIPEEYYVPNRSGSQCVFCSLEILAYYHGVEQLYHLTDRYKHATGPGFIGQLLQERGVNHYQVYGVDKHFQLEWCQWACDNGFACLIGVNGGTHAVVLIELDEEKATIMENGTPSRPYHTMSRSAFERKFSGWVCLIWSELEDPNVEMPNQLRR